MSRVDRIKAWRLAESQASRPCSLADYYAAHPQAKRELERYEQARRQRINRRLKSSELY